MGIFCYKASPIPESLNVEERWRLWINQEKYRRLGWAVYVRSSDVLILLSSFLCAFANPHKVDRLISELSSQQSPPLERVRR